MRTRNKKQLGWFGAAILALAIIGFVYLIYFIAYSWYHAGRTLSLIHI